MISTIIFDFGAVLLPLDEQKTWMAFKALGAKASLKKEVALFKQYEVGALNTDDFLERIQKHFSRKIFKPDLVKAWNAMLISPIEHDILKLLKRLKKKYTLILLSNTNALHVANIKAQTGMFGYSLFTKQFLQVYYSHEMGMRKPNAEIFETVVKEHSLNPENCFYIDDKQENAEAGAEIGFKTWHFNPSEDSILDLDKVLLKLHD